MTVAVWAVVIMLFGHWVADFVWQPDWMGKGKSKSWSILLDHSARIWVGGLVTASVIVLIFGGSWVGLGLWAVYNAIAHFGIDAVTSRMTGKLYARGDTHNFFVVIGFDQFLHLSLAVVTLAWLVL